MLLIVLLILIFQIGFLMLGMEPSLKMSNRKWEMPIVSYPEQVELNIENVSNVLLFYLCRWNRDQATEFKYNLFSVEDELANLRAIRYVIQKSDQKPMGWLSAVEMIYWSADNRLDIRFPEHFADLETYILKCLGSVFQKLKIIKSKSGRFFVNHRSQVTHMTCVDNGTAFLGCTDENCNIKHTIVPYPEQAQPSLEGVSKVVLFYVCHWKRSQPDQKYNLFQVRNPQDDNYMFFYITTDQINEDAFQGVQIFYNLPTKGFSMIFTKHFKDIAKYMQKALSFVYNESPLESKQKRVISSIIQTDEITLMNCPDQEINAYAIPMASMTSE